MGLFGNVSKLLFGGSKSKSETRSEQGNRFADDIKGSFSPWVDQGRQGMGQVANLLGLGGSDAQQGAHDSWWNSSGGQFMLGQGLDQVDAMSRSRGLGQNVAAMKAMEDYRSGLASTKLQNYMGNLFNMNQQALGAGGLIADAGRYGKSWSKSTGSEDKGGLGAGLGALLSKIPALSDRHLKTNVVKVDQLTLHRAMACRGEILGSRRACPG